MRRFLQVGRSLSCHPGLWPNGHGAECCETQLSYTSEMNEADIQVLASVRRAEIENEPSDRATLELHADRFWTFLED